MDDANNWLNAVEKYDREVQTYTGAPTPEDEGHSAGSKKKSRHEELAKHWPAAFQPRTKT